MPFLLLRMIESDDTPTVHRTLGDEDKRKPVDEWGTERCRASFHDLQAIRGSLGLRRGLTLNS